MTEESKEPRKAGQPLGALQLRHLLVAIDGSFSTELALSAAVLVAERDRAKLTLISVAGNLEVGGRGLRSGDSARCRSGHRAGAARCRCKNARRHLH